MNFSISDQPKGFLVKRPCVAQMLDKHTGMDRCIRAILAESTSTL